MKKMLVGFLISCKKSLKFNKIFLMSYPKEKAPLPHPGFSIKEMRTTPLNGWAPRREIIYHPFPMPKDFIQGESLNMTPLKDQSKQIDK